MRLHALVGTSLLYAAGMATACRGDAPPVSGIAMGMRAPLGLLDNATAVQLRVYAGDEVVCEPATGRVSGSAISTQNFALSDAGCSDGASWCQDVTLDRDGEIRTFEVIATATGTVIGRGCDQRPVDDDPLLVDIDIVAEAEPRCCNDGIIQFGEQCDTRVAATLTCDGSTADATAGSCDGIVQDDVCECDCLAREIVLSEGNMNAPGLSNQVATKFGLALAFSGPSGAPDVANSLRAVYTDTDASVSSAPDVNLRVLDPNFYPLQSVLFRQVRLPQGCTTLDRATWITGEQSEPDIARLSPEQMLVVWRDDSEVEGVFDVFGITNNRSGCSDLSAPVKVADGDNSMRHPQVAGGSDGTALVVWNRGGAIEGRTWTGSQVAAGTLNLGTGTPNARPAVAGSPAGFVVAYATGDNEGDVVVQRLSAAGQPLGAPTVAHATTAGIQDQPDVAMLPDGRFAVVYREGEAIRVQRFDASGARVGADDGGATLTDASPAGTDPRVDAAGSTSGSFYAAVWAAPATGEVWGRLFDGQTAFVRNSVNGQFGDFLASHPAIPGFRAEPVVAIGPAFIAFGWRDDEPARYGMKVRRFPLPTL
ncbi:MAG: hypothetical protein AAF928_06325 [Myxococcota bacterium]